MRYREPHTPTRLVVAVAALTVSNLGHILLGCAPRATISSPPTPPAAGLGSPGLASSAGGQQGSSTPLRRAGASANTATTTMSTSNAARGECDLMVGFPPAQVTSPLDDGCVLVPSSTRPSALQLVIPWLAVSSPRRPVETPLLPPEFSLALTFGYLARSRWVPPTYPQLDLPHLPERRRRCGGVSLRTPLLLRAHPCVV